MMEKITLDSGKRWSQVRYHRWPVECYCCSCRYRRCSGWPYCRPDWSDRHRSAHPRWLLWMCWSRWPCWRWLRSKDAAYGKESVGGGGGSLIGSTRPRRGRGQSREWVWEEASDIANAPATGRTASSWVDQLDSRILRLRFIRGNWFA